MRIYKYDKLACGALMEEEKMFKEIMDVTPKWEELAGYEQPDYPGIKALLYEGVPKRGNSHPNFCLYGRA